ncbi:immunoglobulin domain-containing protein [Bdellovibrio sp. ArHS]|uniref:immunoglobulin domain-containing protein n=1 Tax=Bdellovibrio sp. ArHS TaxID=1569284 RepID=UPI000AC11FF3|nr:immunoglobulin domain-containing protein [Bdellovibrio sp. ArHS]
MNTRILKKIRKFRVFSGLLIMSLTVLSFQNCAPAPMEEKTEGSTSSSSTSKDSTSIWNSRPSSGGNNGVSIGGGSGGSSGSGGSVGVGSGSGGNSGSGGGSIGVGGGGASGSGSGGGVGTGGGGTPSQTGFRIAKQPEGVTVVEGGDINLEVVATGGVQPYTYQWYKDSKAMTGVWGTYSFISDSATSYTKEGTYYVVVKDASGKSVQSVLARVSITEPAVGCTAGSYFTFTEASYDAAYGYFPEYFDGPRGKFLLHSSYDTLNFLYNNRSFTKLSDYNVPSTLSYLQQTFVSCRTTIPRIHSPQPNPSYQYEWGVDRYADNGYWNYHGRITFECRNKKLKLVSNTCQWVQDPNYNSGGGGGGGN